MFREVTLVWLCIVLGYITIMNYDYVTRPLDVLLLCPQFFELQIREALNGCILMKALLGTLIS